MILRPLLNPAKHLLSSGIRFVRHGLKKSRTFVTPKDVYEVARLSGQGLLAWTLPEPAWWPVSRVLGPVNVATNPTRTRKEVAQIATLVSGTRFASNAYDVAVKNWAWRYEERFQYLRAWRPGGWSPRIDVVGQEHIAAASSRGNGIIFWGGLFSFNNLLPKIAMHRLGLAVLGFSVPAHGFSASKFGVRYLNRVFRDIENLYLEERLMPWPEDFQVALQRMRERLKVSGVVYFGGGHFKNHGKKHAHSGKGHGKNVHFRRFGYYPWYGIPLATYGGGCGWLYRQVVATGSDYWWDRYYQCTGSYY